MLWEEAGPQRGQEVRLPGQLSGGMGVAVGGGDRLELGQQMQCCCRKQEQVGEHVGLAVLVARAGAGEDHQSMAVTQSRCSSLHLALHETSHHPKMGLGDLVQVVSSAG